MPQPTDLSTVVTVDVTSCPECDDIVGYARDRIGALGSATRRQMRHARVKLRRNHGAAADRHIAGWATLDLSGRLVRAHVEAASGRDVVDRLEARLRRQLDHPYEQRAEHPRLIRRQSFSPTPCSVDEAAVEMGLLKYDFLMFIEEGTQTAAVIDHCDHTGYHVRLVAPDLAARMCPFVLPATISTEPLPCLTEPVAINRLLALDAPFLFYIDAAQGRASVLYRRPGGELAVITPADADV